MTWCLPSYITGHDCKARAGGDAIDVDNDVSGIGDRGGGDSGCKEREGVLVNIVIARWVPERSLQG